jgi:long-chain acyl-CoA synthetase
MNVHPEDVEGALVAEGLVEPVVYESEPGRLAVTYRGGAAFGVPAADGASSKSAVNEASAVATAVRAANGRLAAHQRITGRAPYPDPDFPRTHTRKVRRGAVAERMAGVALSR